MKSYKDLGNRYIKYRKKRALLVTLSMVLATILIYSVTTMLIGFWVKEKALIDEQFNYHGEIYNLTMEQCEKIEKYATVRNADFMAVDIEQSFREFYGSKMLTINYMENVNQSTYNFKIVDGDLPKDSTEILLNKDCLHLFKDEIKVGSIVKTIKEVKVYSEAVPEGMPDSVARDKYGEPEILEEEYIYTVVGIYEYENPNEYAYGITAFSKATEDMKMTAYVRFDKSADWEKYLKTLAMDVGVDIQKSNPYALNDLMVSICFKGDNVPYIAMFLMLMVFIVYTSMAMIRGLFTANLMDNITEFNILKAMGATDKKVKNIFKREVYLEGLTSFVLGGILSHVLFFVLSKAMNTYKINFSFHPIAMLFSFVFLYITITLAIIEPFAVLKKVPIVEGIKANYAINTMKEKKRDGKLFRIFGIEGEYAYKNIRRNSKSFWNGVATFAVSVLVLTVLATALANLTNALEIERGNGRIEDVYDYYTDMVIGDKARLDEAQDAFDRADFIKYADPICCYAFNMIEIAEGLELTEEAKKAVDEKKIKSDDLRVVIMFYTENQLEKLNAYMMDGVDANVIRDGGAILVNNFVINDKDGEKSTDIKLWDTEIGETIKIDTVDYMVKRSMAKGDFEDVKEIPKTEVELEGFCRRELAFGNLVLILSYDYYMEQYGQDLSFLCQGFFIDIDESEFNITDMPKLEKIIYEEAVQLDYEYLNIEKWMEEQTRSVKIVVICVVIFIVLMGVTNILNNMINEYQVRRREVSILRAIGMSKKKLNRMLILEKIIMGIIAWLIGTVLGVLFSKTLLVSWVYITETVMIFPWCTFLLIGAGVICIMVLISIIMVIAMGKKDITDGIRNQE